MKPKSINIFKPPTLINYSTGTTNHAQLLIHPIYPSRSFIWYSRKSDIENFSAIPVR